jgi:hypothetical protein
MKTNSVLYFDYIAFVDVYYSGDIDPVARVFIPNDVYWSSAITGLLEYAWVVTQNVLGSWSIGEYYSDGELNMDYRSGVDVLKPLVDGLGHRSTMIGDIFVYHGVRYMADVIGFKRVDK